MHSGRILCSHLVDLWTPGQAGSPEKAILEEMESLKAALAVERAYQPGNRVLVETGENGPVIPGEVTAIEQRETDRLLRVSFLDGYCWRPQDWTPDHTVAITERSDGASAG